MVSCRAQSNQRAKASTAAAVCAIATDSLAVDMLTGPLSGSACSPPRTSQFTRRASYSILAPAHCIAPSKTRRYVFVESTPVYSKTSALHFAYCTVHSVLTLHLCASVCSKNRELTLTKANLYVSTCAYAGMRRALVLSHCTVQDASGIAVYACPFRATCKFVLSTAQASTPLGVTGC